MGLFSKNGAEAAEQTQQQQEVTDAMKRAMARADHCPQCGFPNPSHTVCQNGGH